MWKGRIVSIEKKELHYGTKIDGIKGYEQGYYDNSDKYHGSNGTYITDLSTESSVEMKVVVYGKTPEENKTVTVDIRDDILQQNDMERVGKKLLSAIQEQNVGNKVNLEYSNKKLSFPNGELKLKRNSDWI